MKYSIIIPSFNHCSDLLIPCLNSIFKYTDLADIEIIISANGCVDDTKNYLDFLQERFTSIGFSEHLKIVWSDSPTGYSKANNDAIKIARGEKIILLNNDIVLLGQEKNDWLKFLDYPFETNPKCGIMYKDILDYSPEWRFYGADDKNAVDPTRCGNPINPLLIESSFGCKVLCTGKSSYEMKKIRKWTEWQSMPHREKSLYDEFQFITVMAQNAGIPRIFIDYAMTIHKDISEQKMFRGMNRDGIKAASIYISCRLNGCPRTAHEIAEIFRLDKTSATNGCSMAVNILQNIERNIEPAHKTDLCATLPSSFIDRYCSRLNFNKEMTMLSKFVANKIEKENIITDNIPHAISAGIVYFVGQVCQSNNTKQEVKVISGVSEVTINKCYKKLDALRESLIPSSILAKYL